MLAVFDDAPSSSRTHGSRDPGLSASMLHRREFLGIAAGAGATLALTPALLRALQQPGGKLIQRAVPSSGEMLPVIGLGRGNDVVDPAAFKEVLKAFVGNGGRVLDTVHDTAGSGERLASVVANELGMQSKVFWSLRGTVPGPPQADAAVLKAHIETSFARLRVPRIDLIQVHVSAPPSHLALLKERKQEGRLRYIGVQAGFDQQLPQLAAMMRDEPIDFVGVRYAIDSRKVEETILPLARERKIGVLAYFPFGGNIGPGGVVSSGLFRRVGDRPLPEWAADFDARSWGQFFLKYVVSHPAVTAVRAGTTKATHMLDNIGGGIGRLPDEATRRRMAALVDALPALPPPPPNPAAAPGIALPVATLDRYVGEWKLASGTVVAFRRDGARLVAKLGAGPELPLNARSETRLQDPRGPVFEFQVDAVGTVTGLVLEQGNPVQRITLTQAR
jgi:aryl-alcohol dehydrogenase-like predicted oxidoreductase